MLVQGLNTTVAPSFTSRVAAASAAPSGDRFIGGNQVAELFARPQAAALLQGAPFLQLAAGSPPSEATAPSPPSEASAPMAPSAPTAAVPSRYENPSLAAAFPGSLEEVPAQFRVRPEDNPAIWLVDGQVRSFQGEVKPVYSRVGVREGDHVKPVLIGYEAQLGPAQAAQAVASAQKAWAGGMGEWPTSDPEQRIAAVEKFLSLMEANQDKLANLLMWEIGKPLTASKKEISRTVEFTRGKIEEYRQMMGQKAMLSGMEGKEGHYGQVVPIPKGVTLAVGPFNYPFNESWSSIMPALLTGNVVLAKLPRFGKLSNQALAALAAQCFPPGVLNLLPGEGRKVLPEIMKATETTASGVKGVVDVFSFIGSEGAYKSILQQHPTPHTLTAVSGLGAKNAGVVLPAQGTPEQVEAKLHGIAKKIVKGALGFNGQRCTAEKMVFVPESQARQLAGYIAEEVSALKVGMPWQDADVTPLPEETKLDSMRAYLDDAVSKGAEVLNAGGGEGTFSLMRPAVVFGVTKEMKLSNEEQFGPILPIAVYKDIQEVYDWHQNSPFGQQASVWGDPGQTRPVAERLLHYVMRTNENTNCKRGPDNFPFSAVRRSGQGECGALETYCRPGLRVSVDKDDF